MTGTSTHEGPSVRSQLRLAGPAVLVCAVSALGLFVVDEPALVVEHLLWSSLPSAWAVDPESGWWIFGVLALRGLVIGLVVQFVPGHGGRDSATTELIAPPLTLSAVLGLVLVTVLGLAGGVSLGPEIPIIAANTAVLVALVARVPTGLVVMTTASGTVGALFGTPVAAALVFTGLAVAVGGTLTGLAAVHALPHMHRFFHGLRHPVLCTTLGGVLLGGLGALGGPVTLFKGAHQTAELVQNPAERSPQPLVLVLVVELGALLVAAGAGFRGGRIFPAVFRGAVVGLLGHALIPGMPLGLSIACGILGVVLPVARDGWIALFIAVAVVGDITVLVVRSLVVLPLWLMVSRAPEMMIELPPVRVGTEPAP